MRIEAAVGITVGGGALTAAAGAEFVGSSRKGNG
jgi:hypothetical protein